MEKKKGPAGPDAEAATSKEMTKSIRHRFAEGETSVMPLADVLRSRDRAPLLSVDDAPKGQTSQRGDKTQVAQAPSGLSPRSPQLSPTQQKTQVVQLTATQAALLSRTEPVATPTPPGPSSQPNPSPSAPRTVPAEAHPPRREPSVRTTLASINRAPDPSNAATQPSAKAKLPSNLADAVDTSVAEVMGEPHEARGLQARAAISASDKTAAAVLAPSGGAKRQRVANGCIVVFSCKGGSGATMLSLNTAYQAAKNGHTACIVDLDLQMGDALAALGLSPRFNIAQASSALAEHVPLAKKLLPTHDSGVAVLSQVGTLDDMDKVTSESMAALVLAVRQTFDIAVIDGVRDFSDNVLAVLDVAEKITIVTVQEVLAVRRARWAFSILRRIGFDPQDITIVLNRYNPAGDISRASIQSMFEPALVVCVPTETATVTQSLNRGVPLLDTRTMTPVVHAVGQVCDNAIYDEIPIEPGSKSADDAAAKPLWRRIFKRSGDT